MNKASTPRTGPIPSNRLPPVNCKHCETPIDQGDFCGCSGEQAERYHNLLVELKADMERQGNVACRAHYRKICLELDGEEPNAKF